MKRDIGWGGLAAGTAAADRVENAQSGPAPARFVISRILASPRVCGTGVSRRMPVSIQPGYWQLNSCWLFDGGFLGGPRPPKNPEFTQGRRTGWATSGSQPGSDSACLRRCAAPARLRRTGRTNTPTTSRRPRRRWTATAIRHSGPETRPSARALPVLHRYQQEPGSGPGRL